MASKNAKKKLISILISKLKFVEIPHQKYWQGDSLERKTIFSYVVGWEENAPEKIKKILRYDARTSRTHVYEYVWISYYVYLYFELYIVEIGLTQSNNSVGEEWM